jgi:hypothetical protein
MLISHARSGARELVPSFARLWSGGAGLMYSTVMQSQLHANVLAQLGAALNNR